MNRKLIAILAIVVVLAAVAGVIVEEYIMPQQQPPVEIRVFAAASLTNVVNASKPAFEKANNAKLLVNLAGSDALYAQLVAGSPADVYMAADSAWLVKLNQKGLLYNDKHWNFTTNILVVILPPDNPKGIITLADLAKSGVRIGVAAWTVPVGKYTNITLTKIDSTWGNKASTKYQGPQWENYRQNVVKNIITYETNVEQVVTKVRMGVVDAGFTYMTDAMFYGQSKLKFVQIAPDVNIQAQYGIGVLKNSTHTEQAMKYLTFWTSKDGQDLLAKYGFGSALPTMSISTEMLQVQSSGIALIIQDTKNAKTQQPINKYACPQ
jgi:molybdate transport system substrate-binding protein